jgi:hypothetical protein
LHEESSKLVLVRKHWGAWQYGIALILIHPDLFGRQFSGMGADGLEEQSFKTPELTVVVANVARPFNRGTKGPTKPPNNPRRIFVKTRTKYLAYADFTCIAEIHGEEAREDFERQLALHETMDFKIGNKTVKINTSHIYIAPRYEVFSLDIPS